MWNDMEIMKLWLRVQRVPNRVLQFYHPEPILWSRSSHIPCILSIPNLVPLLLWNPEYRSSDEANPGSRKFLLGTLSTVEKQDRSRTGLICKIYEGKWNRDNVWKATRKRKSWARFNFYVCTWPSIRCLYFIYARTHVKLRDSGNLP